MVRKLFVTVTAWVALLGMASAQITFDGGDGSTIEQAIIIQSATGTADGVAAEYDWIKKNRPNATVIKQALINEAGRMYDMIEVEENGQRSVLYFDITAFFGKF